ncbi:hypothetical protein FMUND_419 [Fusarium mundagurra]|uniref:Uncharacterized protein n=1 Tax=Fusarium mundagurra TaxID=1567541 RepID=A0A8H5Z8N4_9HYPO|nr:hypothetical protein FMUND_419 [Fusarium mundagurra]
MKDLNGGNFPEDIAGRDLPRPKGGKDDVTEYHVAVDFNYVFTQTECHNSRFIHKLQYDNFDMAATIKHDALEEGSKFRPYKIQMLHQSTKHFTECTIHFPQKTDQQCQGTIGFAVSDWAQTSFLDTFHDSWFYPLIRPLLQVTVRAIQYQHPISPEPIDGRLWVAARQYPKSDLDEYGGVFTDAPGEEFIPLQEFCSENIESAIGKDTDYPLTRL